MNFQHFSENNLCFHIANIFCSYVNTNQVSSFYGTSININAAKELWDLTETGWSRTWYWNGQLYTYMYIYSVDQMCKLARMTYIPYISLQAHFVTVFLYIANHFQHLFNLFYRGTPTGVTYMWYDAIVVTGVPVITAANDMRFMLWHIDMLMLMSQIVFYLLHSALVLSLYIDVVFTFSRRCLPRASLLYTHTHRHPYWCPIMSNLIDHHLTSVSVQIPITWWRHQMETFSALLAICAGNSPVPGEFPT